jgi:hypothetical protein
MVDLCAIASVVLSGWRFDAMEPNKAKGLSRRSQFLLWLLQHQPEIITVEIEYEADDENGDELLDLSEDAELAEALLKDLLATENDAELEANRDFLETAFNKPSGNNETNGESTDGDRAT